MGSSERVTAGRGSGYGRSPIRGLAGCQTVQAVDRELKASDVKARSSRCFLHARGAEPLWRHMAQAVRRHVGGRACRRRLRRSGRRTLEQAGIQPDARRSRERRSVSTCSPSAHRDRLTREGPHRRRRSDRARQCLSGLAIDPRMEFASGLRFELCVRPTHGNRCTHHRAY
jgi:hypothetical protein